LGGPVAVYGSITEIIMEEGENIDEEKLEFDSAGRPIAGYVERRVPPIDRAKPSRP
jgi:hypothetical protein